MPIPRLTLFAVLATFSTAACSSNDTHFARGNGLVVATLPAASQARVYEAAAHGAFNADESLSLLLDPRLLPRGAGLGDGGRLPDAVGDELRQRKVVRGSCEPLAGVLGVPHCTAALPGYVIRFSPVFTLAGDSVQLYLYAQKYDTPNSEPSQVLRFERVYQVVRAGDDWRAVREGRLPK